MGCLSPPDRAVPPPSPWVLSRNSRCGVVAWAHGLEHDVVEDTDVTIEVLGREGAPEEEIAGVVSVTKTAQELNYLARVEKAAADPLGGVVKGFDMLDNSDPGRLAALAVVQPDRAARLAQKYAAGLARLDTLRPGWREASGSASAAG